MDRDAPLLLATAARLAFPDGAVTARGLRREVARGRLVAWKIAGRLFTSLAEIERMRSSCRVTLSLQDSGSDRPKKAAKLSGSSLTADDSIELAALLATAEALSGPSKPTSRPSTRSTGPTTTLIAFPSPRS